MTGNNNVSPERRKQIEEEVRYNVEYAVKYVSGRVLRSFAAVGVVAIAVASLYGAVGAVGTGINRAEAALRPVVREGGKTSVREAYGLGAHNRIIYEKGPNQTETVIISEGFFPWLSINQIELSLGGGNGHYHQEGLVTLIRGTRGLSEDTLDRMLSETTGRKFNARNQREAFDMIKHNLEGKIK